MAEEVEEALENDVASLDIQGQPGVVVPKGTICYTPGLKAYRTLEDLMGPGMVLVEPVDD